MRVTIIANCQARPIADYVRLLGRDVEVTEVLIIHLVKDADAIRLERAAANSDFIFAQLVQPNYPIAFVRSGVLKERYGDRVIVWPNIFFKGQTPDLCYVTAANGARVSGPLGDYHSRPILDSWFAGLSVDETETLMTIGHYDTTGLLALASQSLAELQKREQLCDVGIAERIADRWQVERCFFTFNHPVGDLLLEIARLLLIRAADASRLSLRGFHVNEPLNQFVPPAWPAIVTELQLKYPHSVSSRGVQVDLSRGAVRIVAGAKYYEPRDLISTFYACYECQKSLMTNCRFT